MDPGSNPHQFTFFIYIKPQYFKLLFTYLAKMVSKLGQLKSQGYILLNEYNTILHPTPEISEIQGLAYIESVFSQTTLFHIPQQNPATICLCPKHETSVIEGFMYLFPMVGMYCPK